MSREVFDHTDFGSMYDVAERAHKFIEFGDSDSASSIDLRAKPEVADQAIDFMLAVCRFVGNMHMDTDTEDKARELAKSRMDVMQESDLRVLAEEAMIFDYRVFPGELEGDLQDGE